MIYRGAKVIKKLKKVKRADRNHGTGVPEHYNSVVTPYD
jgi:hypothetical protein